MSYRHGQTHQWWRDDYCPLDALFSPALPDTLIKTHTFTIYNTQLLFHLVLICLQWRRLTLCSSMDSIHCCLCSGSCALRYHTLSLTLMSSRHSSNSWGWKEEEKSVTDQSGSLMSAFQWGPIYFTTFLVKKTTRLFSSSLAWTIAMWRFGIWWDLWQKWPVWCQDRHAATVPVRTI